MKYIIVGAYEDNGDISAQFEGVFNTKKEAQDKLKKLWKEAKNYGLCKGMDSGIDKDSCDIYYCDDTHQIYEIKEFIEGV